MSENAIADNDSTSDDGLSVRQSREEALAAAQACLKHLSGENDDVRALLTSLIDELSKRTCSPQLSEPADRLVELDETSELPRPTVAINDEFDQTQDAHFLAGSAVDVTAVNADNNTPASSSDDDELTGAIAVRKILQDRQEMLRFLDGLFSTFPEYTSLRKKLGVKMGRETPLRVFEECVVQASRFSSTEQQFAKLYPQRIDCLKRYSICALQPGRESALVVQKPLSIDDGLHTFDDELAVEAGTPLFLLEELGQGGFGSVYRALASQREFALKVSNASADNVKMIRRYLREARSLSIANNLPGFIRIHHAGTLHNGSFFLLLEYVDGVDLSRLIYHSDVDQQIHQQAAVVLMYNAAVSLAHLHGKEVFHRDIKPANIMIDRQTGEVRIADLGLAVIEDSHTITETGGIAGTLDYLPPEACHAATTYPADVFALGATMYAIFSGRKLFSFGSDGRAWLQAMSRYQLPSLDAVPQQPIRKLISETLHRDPNQRITMPGVADRLAELMTSPALFGEKQCQYYRKALNQTEAPDTHDSTEFSIDTPSSSQRHLSLDSAALGYITGVINSIIAKPSDNTSPTQTVATVDASGTDGDESANPRDEATEHTIAGVFSRLQSGQRLGRSWPQRMTASLVANQVAVGAGLVAVLIVAGLAQYQHVRNQRVAQVQSRIADLQSLMSQSTPPQQSQLDAAAEQFNRSLQAIDEAQRSDFVSVVRQSDVLDEFTIAANPLGIESIHTNADLKLAELEAESRSEFAVLDGTAQSIPPSLDSIQLLVIELLSLDYAPSLEQLGKLCERCVPAQVKGAYAFNISADGLTISHKAESEGIRRFEELFKEINRTLDTVDGPHDEAVQILLHKINMQISTWQHRTEVRGSVVSEGLETLPDYVVVARSDSGIQLLNKVVRDEEGNKSISWRFGRLQFDQLGTLSRVYLKEETLELTRIADFGGSQDAAVARVGGGIFSTKSFDSYVNTLFHGNDHDSSIQTYTVFSIIFRKGETILFINGLSGLIWLSSDNKICRIYDSELLTLEILGKIDAVGKTDFSDFKGTLNMPRNYLNERMKRLHQFAGFEPTLAKKRNGFMSEINFTEFMTTRKQHEASPEAFNLESSTLPE